LLNAQQDAQAAAAQPSAAKLNAAICERARHRDEVQFLVSPVSGSGVFMPRLAQLFLLARLHGLQQPAQWAEFAANALRGVPEITSATTTATGISATAEPSLAELTAKAHRFAEVHLPILQALRIV
jgi:hypothetical protein